MLIKIRPLYKERMRQDQAHTRAHDTYGTITQQSTVTPSTRTIVMMLIQMFYTPIFIWKFKTIDMRQKKVFGVHTIRVG